MELGYIPGGYWHSWGMASYNIPCSGLHSLGYTEEHYLNGLKKLISQVFHFHICVMFHKASLIWLSSEPRIIALIEELQSDMASISSKSDLLGHSISGYLFWMGLVGTRHCNVTGCLLIITSFRGWRLQPDTYLFSSCTFLGRYPRLSFTQELSNNKQNTQEDFCFPICYQLCEVVFLVRNRNLADNSCLSIFVN